MNKSSKRGNSKDHFVLFTIVKFYIISFIRPRILLPCLQGLFRLNLCLWLTFNNSSDILMVEFYHLHVSILQMETLLPAIYYDNQFLTVMEHYVWRTWAEVIVESSLEILSFELGLDVLGQIVQISTNLGALRIVQGINPDLNSVRELKHRLQEWTLE